MSSTLSRLIDNVKKGAAMVAAIPVAVIGYGIMAIVKDGVTRAKRYDRLEDAKSNHARFESTWTPRELRIRKLERVERKRVESEQNHAAVEGFRR